MALLVDEGVRYPFRGDRSVDLLAIGGLLGILTAILFQLAAAAYPSLLAVPFVGAGLATVVVLLGYLLSVFRTTVAGEETPPAFRPIAALFRDGCRLLVISVAIAVGPAISIAITVGGLLQVPVSPDSLGFVGSLLFFGASTFVLVLIVAFGYVYPVAIGHVANGGRLREALAIRAYGPILGHGGYFTAWMFGSLFVVPGWAFLLTALSSATLFGVVAAFVTFYAHVVGTRLVARGYRTAADGHDQ